jgi:hypothetical protein
MRQPHHFSLNRLEMEILLSALENYEKELINTMVPNFILGQITKLRVKFQTHLNALGSGDEGAKLLPPAARR